MKEWQFVGEAARRLREVEHADIGTGDSIIAVVVRTGVALAGEGGGGVAERKDESQKERRMSGIIELERRDVLCAAPGHSHTRDVTSKAWDPDLPAWAR